VSRILPDELLTARFPLSNGFSLHKHIEITASVRRNVKRCAESERWDS